MSAGDAKHLRQQRHASFVIVGLVMSIFIGTASVDHGYNWDEWALLEATRASVREVEVVQPRHIYNGFYLSCALAVVAAHGIDDLPGAIAEIKQMPVLPFEPARYRAIQIWQTDMYRLLGSEEFKLEVRRVFLGLTSLAILWVFLTVLRLFPRRYLEAAGAAALMGLSWEIAVRARCTEVDAPQMMLVALHVYLTSVALTATTRNRTLLAMMGVGLATGLVIGCKMTGIFLGLPSVMLAWFAPTHRSTGERLLLVLAMLAALGGALAFFAPETFSDPIRVLHQAFNTAEGYRSVQPGYPFYVEPPHEHFYRIQLWTFLVAPSPVVPVAAALSGISLIGFVRLVRRRKAFSLLVAIYPLAVVVTMSTLPLLQQRNFLQLFPYVCVAFGAGLTALRVRWPSRRVSQVLAAAVGAAFLFNAGWLFYAQRSVRDTTRDSILEDVTAEIDSSDHDYYTSRRLYTALQGPFDADFECVGPRPDEPEMHDPRVLIYYTDHVPRQWLSVRMGFVEHTFAPLDQNYDWYATWKGHLEHHRVVLVSMEHAAEMNVDLRRLMRCRRR
ncbi:MAG: glycosyltransferase family 39 protein [Sandaracinaceae bacterium]|nr:glycosyltransferase family 39 protein [Sandaracinaceae bacterium]